MPTGPLVEQQWRELAGHLAAHDRQKDWKVAKLVGGDTGNRVSERKRGKRRQVGTSRSIRRQPGTINLIVLIGFLYLNDVCGVDSPITTSTGNFKTTDLYDI